MSYRYLIPSMTDYAKKFRQLDHLDFRIINAMLKHGIFNVSKVAKEINSPQQTVSYRTRRLDSEDLVRFRALINESKLGLKSFAVVASAPIGKEEVSGTALTIFPLWRYLATIDGWKRGNYVRYAIPSDKERDLVAFLRELERRELISDFEITATASPVYPLLDLGFYSKKDQVSIFDWQKWVNDFDSFTQKRVVEPLNYEKSEYDLIDLIILRCLEMNARTTQRNIVKEICEIFKETDCAKYIPLVSRRIRKNIELQGLINGYRVYLFPNQESTTLLLMFYLVFSSTSNLQKFLGALNHLPYNTTCEKILDKDALFLRLAIPAYECCEMRRSLMKLAEVGYLKDAHLLFGDLARGTWDNVEIHQMFKDGTWNFSYGAAVEILEKAGL